MRKMLQSKLFTRTLREIPKEEQSVNAQLLIQGGFIDKLFAGVYTMLPLGWRVARKIAKIIREEMNQIGGQEIFMPALHPLENYKKTGRDKIEVLFYTNLRNGMKLVLGQSHEEIVTPLAQKYIFSYKDLPKAVYQIQTKFRNELRAKSGIFRGREFLMKDLYSFHTDEEDLEKYYKIVQKAYFRIFARCDLASKTYLTYASGGTFSKYSHEFQTVTSAGEDTIYICQNCNLAINQEIKNGVKKCPECGRSKFRKAKAIEVANIFKLGTKFSQAFGWRFTNEKGRKESVVMGCYGIGLGRLMGAIVEIHHDDRGIIWPESVAPFDIHLLLLSNEKKVASKAERIYRVLQKRGVEILYDNREETAGVKLKDADLIGIPTRLVVSDKTEDRVEIKHRDKREVRLLSLKKLLQSV